MQVWHIWIIVGFVMLILEVFTPGFFLASIGIGAFMASFASYFKSSLTIQITALAAGTLITFIFARRFFALLHNISGDDRRTGVEALIGRDAVVVEPITGSHGCGRVKIGGEEWKACALQTDNIPEGATVTVEKIEGVTVFVKPRKMEA